MELAIGGGQCPCLKIWIFTTLDDTFSGERHLDTAEIIYDRTLHLTMKKANDALRTICATRTKDPLALGRLDGEAGVHAKLPAV